MKKDIYPVVMNAIRTGGIDTVRNIVYGANVDQFKANVNEGVAMSNFISSRMFEGDIIKRLKSL